MLHKCKDFRLNNKCHGTCDLVPKCSCMHWLFCLSCYVPRCAEVGMMGDKVCDWGGGSHAVNTCENEDRPDNNGEQQSIGSRGSYTAYIDSTLLKLLLQSAEAVF